MQNNSGLDNTENIKIFSTDHQKIKLAGEILSNGSSRNILQVLFEDEFTANEISQKIGISLQLVKYHVERCRILGLSQYQRREKILRHMT